MAALPASASAPNLLAAADAVMTPQRSSLSLSIDVAAPTSAPPPKMPQMASSPSLHSASLMRRMTSVMKQRDCVVQQEAWQKCLATEAGTGGLMPKSSSCQDLMSAMRACHTISQHHNRFGSGFA